MPWISRKPLSQSAAGALVALLLSFVPYPAGAQSDARSSPGISPPPDAVWSELLQRSPYPFTLPIPPQNATPIDGTYVKIETKEEPAVHCRRCPDYALEGGLWKLSLSKGVFRIFHPITGWKGIGSYYISADQLILANDPVCHELWAFYRWTLEQGNLTLILVEDRCAIGLRAMNLTHLPWQSCRPPNVEAAVTEHWPKPAGCD